jgi:hypothetical protein
MSHIRLVILFTLFTACCIKVISVTGIWYTQQYPEKYFINADKYIGLSICRAYKECAKHTKPSEMSQILLPIISFGLFSNNQSKVGLLQKMEIINPIAKNCCIYFFVTSPYPLFYL